MLKRLAAAVTAATLAATTASAFDIGAMTAEEREAFRSEIRRYLLDDPEVLLEAIAVLEKRQTQEQTSLDTELVQENADQIFADGHSWEGGNPGGDVTIIEFIDYRCGFCRRAHPEVSELIGSDGNVRFIVKELPILGEQSLLASKFALAVKQVEGDSAYAETHDALMTMRAAVTDLSLFELSKRLGYDSETVMDAMGSDAVQRAISQNHALAQRLRIEGTPTFVFGDRIVRGYVQLEEMHSILADLRKP